MIEPDELSAVVKNISPAQCGDDGSFKLKFLVEQHHGLFGAVYDGQPGQNSMLLIILD